MQLIGLIDATSYSSKLESKNTKKANQKMNMMICLLKFGINTRDPFVSVEVA
jgi:hypothetical protein